MPSRIIAEIKSLCARPECAALLALFVIGFVPRLLLFHASIPVLWADSLTYASWAKAIAHDGDIAHHAVYRTPLYPLFLSFFISMFESFPRGALLVLDAQRIMGFLTGWFLFCIGKRAFGHTWIAFLGAALFLLSPRQLYYETAVMTETLFTFLLTLGIWLALVLLQDEDPRARNIVRYALFGSLFAVLTLTRPIAQLLLPLILLFLIWRRGRSVIPGALAALVMFAFTVFPWIELNHRTYDYWGISADRGLNLYHRVIDIDRATPVGKHATAYRGIRALHAEAVQKGQRITYFSVYYGLTRRGLSPIEADKLMGGFAFETLQHDPWHFLPHSLQTFRNFFLSPRGSVRFCTYADAPPYFCSPIQDKTWVRWFSLSPGPLSIHARRAVNAIIASWIFPEWLVGSLAMVSIIFFFGYAKNSPKMSALLLTLVILYFAGITAAYNRAEDRFRLPVDGFIFLFACYGIYETVRAIRRKMPLRAKQSGAPLTQ